MQELEQWARAEVIDPLLYAGAQSVEDAEFDWEGTAEKSLKAIRTKVLESYHNGLAAGRRDGQGPTRPEYPRKGYQPNREVRTSRWPVRV